MLEKILRLPAVREASGLSRSTLYGRISDGTFPKPFQLGPRCVGWREAEVAAVNSARIRGVSNDELRALVKRLERERLDAA